MLMYGLEVIAIGVLMLMEIFLKEWSSSTLHKAMILILRKMYELFILCDGGSGSKKSCLVIFKDLNELETLILQNVKIQFWSKVIAISISAFW